MIWIIIYHHMGKKIVKIIMYMSHFDDKFANYIINDSKVVKMQW
jgi:hypothetical protein